MGELERRIPQAVSGREMWKGVCRMDERRNGEMVSPSSLSCSSHNSAAFVKYDSNELNNSNKIARGNGEKHSCGHGRWNGGNNWRKCENPPFAFVRLKNGRGVDNSRGNAYDSR